MALIAQAATLEARIPFIHFFDGFRTSHEVQKIEQLTDDDHACTDQRRPGSRAPAPRHSLPSIPCMRGTAQNPDVFFQARETCNPFYAACPDIVQKVMDKFAAVVGRQYKLFEYVGSPTADRVIVMMGSGAEAAQEAVEYLNTKGENVGL